MQDERKTFLCILIRKQESVQLNYIHPFGQNRNSAKIKSLPPYLYHGKRHLSQRKLQ